MMPTFTKDPVTGRILMDGVPLTDANAYGTAGRLYADQQGVGLTNDNPNYQQTLGGYLDESGNMVNRTGLAPGVADRMGGQLQLPQFGVGGYNEVKDPSHLRWNPEFGAMSSPGNISAGDPATRRRGITFVALGAGAGLAAEAGLLGSGMGSGAGAAPTVADAGLLNAADYIVPAADGTLGSWAGTGLEAGAAGGVTPTMGDAGMLNAADYTVPAANPTMAATPDLGGGWLEQLRNYATNNPLRTAQLGMSLGNMAGGLLGGSHQGGGGWSGAGLTSGLLSGTQGTQNRSTYQPNQYTTAQLQRLYGG